MTEKRVSIVQFILAGSGWFGLTVWTLFAIMLPVFAFPMYLVWLTDQDGNQTRYNEMRDR